MDRKCSVHDFFIQEETHMSGTFWALVPPIVAIVLALITKETYSSLFVGILVGALFVGGFNPVASLDAMINDGFIGAIADGWNAGIFMFLVLLGIMVALVNAAGGSAAFGRWAVKRVHTRTGALLATFLLGVLIFIDDYFNCLTVGSVMRPVTDSHKISREKLAFIIDATAAPICMIAPVSSWAAAVSATAQDLGSGISGIQLFIRAIPYNFYSLLTIVFVIAISVLGIDYGPMAKAELRALQTGELGSLGNDEEVDVPRASIWDMLVPVILLIVSCIIGMMYIGGFWDGASLIDSFADTDASVGLPWGSIVAVILTFVYLLCRRVISFKDATDCITKGFVAMVPAMLILTFALTLKNMTGMLGAADYVAGLVEGAAAGLFSLLPAVIFLVALGLAFSTGTSWGTFGILIPIVLPVFSNNPELLMIGISACLAGAVCGDHCSPISDTTIMASAGANVNHIAHVSTQLPYALTVAGVSFVCYLIAGFVHSWLLCLVIGAACIVGMLFYMRSIRAKFAE
ncbi:MAG: Na+/H+ antiporter NhaC family protein [Oscillospiraceae bacterium]|nr:Na+/H+ antiporter NhaC family protein [Oscillospiraceae bacterium]